MNNSTDNNAAKTVALDHLGIIAARLTTSSLKFKNDVDHESPLKSLEEVRVYFFFFEHLAFYDSTMFCSRFLQRVTKHN